ncbi:MAG: FeS-binding protein [Dehalococcoidia bacterium]|nr:FeS-binding protein [Dehalococcoidia bacterium]
MAKRRVMFTFQPDLITEPVIYTLGRKFRIATNIRRADVKEDRGWAVLELDGKPEDIERGLEWVRSKGVRVDPISGDVLEG